MMQNRQVRVENGEIWGAVRRARRSNRGVGVWWVAEGASGLASASKAR